MIREENLIIFGFSAIVLVSILTKYHIIHHKYFQLLFNLIFFAYVYACFQYNYMWIMKAGAVIYGSVILVCWGIEVLKKKR